MSQGTTCRSGGWAAVFDGVHHDCFFHIRRNDVFEEDLEGIDLASPEQAREEATAAARE
ncbi:DUF6894 family protein [Rhizobium laguerreae]|uniref:DUF6894 family protein n=1 Tax=Rhizobium laguerreae TaxID=1076926 RepID=UPI0035E423EF